MVALNPQLSEAIRQAHTSYAETASQVCKAPPAALVPIFDTLAQAFGEPTWAHDFEFGTNLGAPLRGTECLSSGWLHWSRTPYAVPFVWRLVEYYDVDEALRLVANEDVDAIRGRDDHLRSLLRSQLFLTKVEMADHLDAFIRCLRQERHALVSTGYPSEPFHAWPAPQVANHYPVEYAGEAFDSAIDAERLVNGREAMFSLKLQVLERLARGARRQSAVGLWEDCLGLLTDALTAHDVDFYIEADLRRGAALHQASQLSRTCWWEFLPGGLTEMIALLGQCECALKVGATDSTKRALVPIVDPDAKAPYLAILNSPDRNRVDAALDSLDGMWPHEAEFWRGYTARVEKALHNDFDVTLPGPRVKRCHAEQLELWLQQVVAQGCRYLGQSGTLPEISIPNPEPICRNRFLQVGKSWLLEFDGQVAPMPDGKGMKYLAQLLRHPGKAIHVLDLVRAVDGGPDPAARIDHRPEGDVLKELGTARLGMGDSWPVMDDQTRRETQRRIVELEEEVEFAEQMGNAHKAEMLRSEKSDILEHLRTATSLDGHTREWGSTAEKARSAIAKAIDRARKEIEFVHPRLGEHLKSVSTGNYCTYNPLSDPPAWEF